MNLLSDRIELSTSVVFESDVSMLGRLWRPLFAAGFALLEIAVCRRHGIGDVGEIGDRELATTLRYVLD